MNKVLSGCVVGMWCIGIFAEDAVTTNRIVVDFAQTNGVVKPLHGVNNAPRKLWGEQESFREAGIPYMRTHDSCGQWGGAHFVDIPNIFPKFDADEDDPASYDFAFTDHWLATVIGAGTKVFYRLGVTIENNWKIKAYNIRPPKDFAKWARICEHVVRHYNEGWADGFKWGIDYWEIWGEPENPPLWQGTREQYFELYRVASKHLKKCFPKIKVGGYGGCGFYALDASKADDFRKSFLSWFDDFCGFVTNPETACPLDFFSWHVYLSGDDVQTISEHSTHVRQALDTVGLVNTENILDEWNRIGPTENEFDEMKGPLGAAMAGEAFCVMQNVSVDKAMYYDALPTRRYCGLYHFPSGRTTMTYEVFRLWNQLYRLGMAVICKGAQAGLGVSAARGKSGHAVLIANNSPVKRMVSVAFLAEGDGQFYLVRLDEDHAQGKDREVFSTDRSILMPPRSIVYIADF